MSTIKTQGSLFNLFESRQLIVTKMVGRAGTLRKNTSVRWYAAKVLWRTLKCMCTRAKYKSFGIKCNTNTQYTNSAHTTLHVDSISLYKINILILQLHRLFMAVRAFKLYTHGVHSASPPKEVLFRYRSFRRKNYSLWHLKMDGRAAGTKKPERLPFQNLH